MTTLHTEHPSHTHAHGPACGHTAVPHGDHTDYAHDGHLHREHAGHWDECEADGHNAHEGHAHQHGAGCGHESVLHGDHVAARAEALLFAADKAHHVDQLIRPAIERGAVVVTDRYTDSSVAYQGSGRDLGAVEVHDLQMWAVGSLVPNLTVIVDVPSDEGRRRRGEVHDRLESEGDTLHDTVRQHFLAMAQGSPERYLVVDGTSSPEEIHDAVMGRLTSSGLLEVGSP